MTSTEQNQAPPIMPTAIDLFAGAGGLTCGLKAAGYWVPAAVELDRTSASTYSLNHPSASLLIADIRKITGPTLLRAAGLKRGELSLLTGCPPCQGFSSLQTRRRLNRGDDPRNDLVLEVLRLLRSTRPKALILENVPGLTRDRRFQQLTEGLARSGYHYDFAVLDARKFGVPQRRKRLVLVALAGRPVPSGWDKFQTTLRTVRDAIGGLAAAGLSGDRLHDLPERRSEAVLERIRATPLNGGSRSDLPSDMQCECHRSGVGFSDVYGRMSWDEQAPTITSGCHNPSKGRFIHPEEHRSITLREAALLQSFPSDYQFDTRRGKEHVARQIGNAFPPRMITPVVSMLREVME